MLAGAVEERVVLQWPLVGACLCKLSVIFGYRKCGCDAYLEMLVRVLKPVCNKDIPLAVVCTGRCVDPQGRICCN